MLHYATQFDKHYNPFYNYSIKNGRRKLGLIPAGINTTYRKYQLDTIKVMQQLQYLFNTNQLPHNLISTHSSYEWYDEKTNTFNKQQMYKLQKTLDKLCLKKV